MPTTIQISSQDAAGVVHETQIIQIYSHDAGVGHEAQHVQATPSGVVGMPDTVSVVSVAPQVHPHDQEHRQPLETVEIFSLSSVVVGYAALRLIRQSLRQPPSASS
jgi:hypothetical protein